MGCPSFSGNTPALGTGACTALHELAPGMAFGVTRGPATPDDEPAPFRYHRRLMREFGLPMQRAEAIIREHTRPVFGRGCCMSRVSSLVP
jgi:hypothetical protein